MKWSKNAGLFLLVLLAIDLLAPALIPHVEAKPSGMEQVIFGGYYTGLSTTITKYNSLVGGYTWDATESKRNKPVSTDGKFKNLRVLLNDPPGVADKYTFTLILNGAPTTLTIDIIGTNWYGEDMVHEIDVTGGDTISLQCVPDNSPAVRTAIWTCIFESDMADESLIMGGSSAILSRLSIEYAQVMGAYTWPTTNENNFRQVVPTSGTIKNLYVKLNKDPGNAPDAYRFTLRENGISQVLTVTITADDMTGSNLASSFTVVAGDILTMMIEPLNGPVEYPYAQWGMTFVADVDGESIVLGGSYDNLPTTDTENHYLTSYEGATWIGWPDEDERFQFGQVCTLKKLHVLLSSAPGVGNKYDFTLMIDEANSNVVATVSGIATTGNSGALEDTVALGDNNVYLKVVPDSTPDVADAYWGFVCYIPAPADYLYTEKIATFSIAIDAVFTDYDLYNLQGVPKGRVAEIVCANKNDDFARIAGVRTDGSALNRYIDLHEAEGLGVTTSSMFVKVDETTGLIECYSEVQDDIEFVLLGYFSSDVEFTESFTSLGQPGLVWADKDLTASGVPDDAVVQILMGNELDNADLFAGVREHVSGFERGVTLDEAEADGWSTLSMVVQSDSGAVIEWKGGSVTDVTMWLLGWFSTGVSFTEEFTDYSPTVDNTWTDKTMADSFGSSVAVFALVHEDSGSETFCGLRGTGSALSRYIEEHEAEGGSSTGFQACVALTALKECEVYCEDASESQFYYTGYFIITPPEEEEEPPVDYFPMLLAIVMCLSLSAYFLYVKNN